jgi:hypothetical protein
MIPVVLLGITNKLLSPTEEYAYIKLGNHLNGQFRISHSYDALNKIDRFLGFYP